MIDTLMFLVVLLLVILTIAILYLAYIDLTKSYQPKTTCAECSQTISISFRNVMLGNTILCKKCEGSK